jgi:hypothetical protein
MITEKCWRTLRLNHFFIKLFLTEFVAVLHFVFKVLIYIPHFCKSKFAICDANFTIMFYNFHNPIIKSMQCLLLTLLIIDSSYFLDTTAYLRIFLTFSRSKVELK